MSFAHISSNIGLLSYALSSLLYIVAMQSRPLSAWWGRTALILFGIATCSITLSLAGYMGKAKLLDLSGLMLTSAVGWLAIHGSLQFGLRLLGPFVAPLATLILLAQFFVAPIRDDSIPLGPNSILALVHITLAILGQAFAIIACGISVLYLWQQNLLKKKRLDQLPRSIPAIDRLDALLVMSLWAGFLLITLGLVSGAIYIQVVPEMLEHTDYTVKVIWAIFVWIWYLATLLARNVFHRPSKRIAQMALGGFLLLAATYFGMGIIRPLGGA